jgi:HK97 gp10 family phage protein
VPGVTIKKNDLGRIAANVRPLASQVVRKAAADVEAHAKTLVPVDTGATKASIQVDPIDDLHSNVVVGTDYAPFIEYGTSRSPAQPYLTPAADAVRPGFEAAIKQVFERG